MLLPVHQLFCVLHDNDKCRRPWTCRRGKCHTPQMPWWQVTRD